MHTFCGPRPMPTGRRCAGGGICIQTCCSLVHFRTGRLMRRRMKRRLALKLRSLFWRCLKGSLTAMTACWRSSGMSLLRMREGWSTISGLGEFDRCVFLAWAWRFRMCILFHRSRAMAGRVCVCDVAKSAAIQHLRRGGRSSGSLFHFICRSIWLAGTTSGTSFRSPQCILERPVLTPISQALQHQRLSFLHLLRATGALVLVGLGPPRLPDAGFISHGAVIRQRKSRSTA